ncbi:CGNR zinc finger domain-containing protein [Actinotalea subterranea]|uniref:CGNR zinc finger domain-containing protein n=1 Tax=Actinotalea subterranea TaxID=2607497 RepID=UPI0011EEC135|nr:CGNR zinc finger domain-containing protein [Actinotalea subterranea]
MQQSSEPDLRRRFRTGRPCLDLAHTGGEDELARWEIVHGPDDVGRLLARLLDIPAPPADERDLAALRVLRGAVTRIAYGLAEGTPPVTVERPRPGDVAAINAAAALPPLTPALLPDGVATVVAPTATAALSTLARDAIDLFGSPLAQRIRVCAAENCGLLLVDTSRANQRRWCSMEVCGNRAKVRAHRADA